MATGGAEELEKPPASFKSCVWEHCGFSVKFLSGMERCERELERERAGVCDVSMARARERVHP